MGNIRRAGGRNFEVSCPNCDYSWDENLAGGNILQMTDLREISRGSRRCRTKVYLTDRVNLDRHELWLDFGKANFLRRESDNQPSLWTISSYLAHCATDIYKDSVFALAFDVIALELSMVHAHHVVFEAIVDPMQGNFFRVPRPGYNPLLHPDTVICQNEACLEHHCGAHPIVPDGFYQPPHDPELFEAVRCRPIEIHLITLGDD
jgi:hypothetical protein